MGRTKAKQINKQKTKKSSTLMTCLSLIPLQGFLSGNNGQSKKKELKKLVLW